MAYSGQYRVINKEKYAGDFTNIIYRSMWEKYVFKWCDTTPEVKQWSSEEIIIPYYYDVDRKYHRYFPDLKIVMTNGSVFLIEIKPKKETAPPTGARKTKQYISEGLTFVKNQNKWKAANNFAQDRGWKFQVWTEDTLQQMGIMPKSTKGLKPLKPLKPYKKHKKSI